MEWINSPQAWISLATLTVLEIVLGIDNLVFITILSDGVAPELRSRARRLGLLMAMFTRITLLVSIVWMMKLTRPLFTVMGHAVSGRDLILLMGGAFLLSKSTREIHQKLEGGEGEGRPARSRRLLTVVVQIAVLDLVFSLDSVITAVGVADHLTVMILAVVIAVIIMMLAANRVAHVLNSHPTLKMLALSFLLLIGMSLVAEGMHRDVPKGYIYFAMGFSIFVEMLNLRARRTKEGPVHLRGPHLEAEETSS